MSEWFTEGIKEQYISSKDGKSFLYIHTREGNIYTIKIKKLSIKMAELNK